MPEMPDLGSARFLAAGVGALGVIAMAVVGMVKITTPEAEQCGQDLAAAKVRLEFLAEAKEACRDALSACHPKEGP